MKFYPINLNLRDKKVLIVGAGRVALRKFKRLLQAGAQIKITSPEFNQEFLPYLNQKSEKYIFLKRKFRDEDLNGQFLVFAATNNSELNRRIAFLARKKNILVNTADNAEISDFTLPAIVNRGELLLTISTGSSLPALSKNIRKKMESEFGIEYQLLLDIMSGNRGNMVENIENNQLRKNIFRKIAADDFLIKIRDIIDNYDSQILANDNYNLKKSEYLALKEEIKKEITYLIARTKNNQNLEK
ncbi:bifunctional precorrin-2 dehydrogenase/sirohydrochlorin ferrochelatase [Halanaerobium sp. MA284_MarDTE_T2]|uniref:precorrin-2 dehydrogenase/sirohydrochlorin ferrochelatase family protein n=1 Tax=Halanaerobium sp. MA284_MarDTE_T2 TaxID=2183913 RepID=UPI000DF1B9AD|nr:bifunctional precorrin-2 dehydrogenase/sirohydrochlorin ferrochelatase [Halanaerobium sp. MA284_MarDTE_T2]RCW50429.1 precorrin-2 dehydrogenase/sirohydrochlorin ferrochelatase [Halanaerobium sp. MA284_MarDTE_T2]